MTKSEYLKAYREAKRNFGDITLKTARQIQRTYISASLEIAKKIKTLEKANASTLTIESLRNLEIQIQQSTDELLKILDKRIKNSMTNSISLTSNINEQYIIDTLKDVPNTVITTVGIKNMYNAMNNLVIQSTINRVFTDGYNYAQSIWNAGLKYQQEMKDIVAIGLTQNKSTIKIARDLNVYTKDGKLALASRYGPNMIIKRNGKKRINWKAYEKKYGKEATRKARVFMRRIGNTVDWRALRIARSELYMSLQDASRMQGRINPACNQLFEWVLTAGRQDWKCDCAKLAKDGPYKYEKVPGYPHPNCRCYVRPLLMDRRQFENNLTDWVNGKSVPYLDEWYVNYYQPLSLT